MAAKGLKQKEQNTLIKYFKIKEKKIISKHKYLIYKVSNNNYYHSIAHTLCKINADAK